jgi:haloalkane dehalogenase
MPDNYADFDQYDVEVDGFRIHTVDTGSGEPVMLMHGSPVSSFSFRHQIAALAPRFRVIAPDLPGFGRSDAPDEGVDFERQARLLRGFVTQIDPGPLRLLVHNWGGPIGVAALADRADQIRQLALVNTTLRSGFKPPAYWKPFTAPALGELLLVRLNVFGRGLPTMLDAAGDSDVHAVYRRALETEGTRQTVLALERLAGYEAVAATCEQALPALRAAEGLILWGTPDPYFRQAERDWLRDAFPAAAVREIPGGGHFPQEDAPDAVTDALLDFFA